MIRFRKIALGGGGVKGLLHLGALQELAKHQLLEFPDGVYGSSIGAIIGTYIAFKLPLEKGVYLTKKYLNSDRIFPETCVSDIFETKGIFTMDMFEDAIVKMFLEVGLDIRTKVIADAKMPLYIITSNISKGTPSILTNKVPLLEALKCSCCLPFIFRPQELYGQLYVDGGLFTRSISIHAEDALCLSLKKTVTKVTLKNIKSIHPLTYIHRLYDMSTNYTHCPENTVSLMYPNLHANSDLNDFDISDVLKHSGQLMSNFLASKRRNQECA